MCPVFRSDLVTCVPPFNCAAIPALQSAATTVSKLIGLFVINCSLRDRLFAVVSTLFGPILRLLGLGGRRGLGAAYARALPIQRSISRVSDIWGRKVCSIGCNRRFFHR